MVIEGGAGFSNGGGVALLWGCCYGRGGEMCVWVLGGLGVSTRYALYLSYDGPMHFVQLFFYLYIVTKSPNDETNGIFFKTKFSI